MTIDSSSTTVVVSSVFGSAVVTVSGLPSGSESLASTCTETLRPGRTVTSSVFATGLRVPSRGAEMPTRTVPSARAPSVSVTV